MADLASVEYPVMTVAVDKLEKVRPPKPDNTSWVWNGTDWVRPIGATFIALQPAETKSADLGQRTLSVVAFLGLVFILFLVLVRR